MFNFSAEYFQLCRRQYIERERSKAVQINGVQLLTTLHSKEIEAFTFENFDVVHLAELQKRHVSEHVEYRITMEDFRCRLRECHINEKKFFNLAFKFIQN